MPKIGDDALNIFHFVIIAYLAANLCGCGYKADPFYSGDFGGANSACGDFSRSASAHSLQRTPSASHSFASHNHENSLTILEFANSVEKDSANCG